VSGQLESRHFFRVGDIVTHWAGSTGTVIDGQALYATIQWSDGRVQEIDQFDAEVEVVERRGAQ
jgi:hypothetical protein